MSREELNPQGFARIAARNERCMRAGFPPKHLQLAKGWSDSCVESGQPVQDLNRVGVPHQERGRAALLERHKIGVYYRLGRRCAAKPTATRVEMMDVLAFSG